MAVDYLQVLIATAEKLVPSQLLRLEEKRQEVLTQLRMKRSRKDLEINDGKFLHK
jgi:hypothetical protein